MDIASKYEPRGIEQKWYQQWMDLGFFHSEPDDREPYTIVIPPPNVTGVLHMGHMLNNTIQDVLVRRARMLGKNACWVPGTDHASIATEAKVVQKLEKEGISKTSISREDFLKHAWEWREKHGGIILEQLKKLGASCDWKRTKFTMDDEMSDSVIKVFIDLYNKGKIYRGVRMVNWDPQAQTAVSDEEVNYYEEQSKLYYIKYPIENHPDEFVTIATTRPETILGDTAVCVNPADERFKHLKGKRVYVPLIDRLVPFIEDDYVDMEFGTGCLKITPAHDENDYEIGDRHQLPAIDIFNDDGTLNENAQLYVGKDRFEVRKLIAEDLKNKGYLIKTEDYVNKVGYSERTNVVIEPKLSMQWFVKMKELAQPALDAVMNDEVKLVPPKFKNTYRHWMENVRDWCISRQLWWGQRIPVYYIQNTNDFVVAPSEEEALKMAKEKSGNNALTMDDLKQDEDVVDTWFSSWLWPISVFDGFVNPGNKDIQYYYPTNDLVTAPEILFFWVARMIIAGYEYMEEKPFENVYLTGIVRDAKRQKMSKSLGNSPDPLELIDEYGADGVRVGMLLSSPAGNDLLFDVSLCEQGRNFANKIWNAFRLVKSWQVDASLPQPAYAKQANNWFEARLDKALQDLNKSYDQFRISEALMTVYRLFWDDFSSWYLEAVKPAYQKPIDQETYKTVIAFFEKLMQIIHPLMPFITEEIWHHMRERDARDCIMVSQLPQPEGLGSKLVDEFEFVKEIISNVRTIRKNNQLSNREELELKVLSSGQFRDRFNDVIKKLAVLKSIDMVDDKVEGALSFIVGTVQYFIPMEENINVEEEIKKVQEELDYAKGFLRGVNKKLDNDKFVNNAPEAVVEKEKQKRNDAESRIKSLEERLNTLKN